MTYLSKIMEICEVNIIQQSKRETCWRLDADSRSRVYNPSRSCFEPMDLNQPRSLVGPSRQALPRLILVMVLGGWMVRLGWLHSFTFYFPLLFLNPSINRSINPVVLQHFSGSGVPPKAFSSKHFKKHKIKHRLLSFNGSC